MEINVERMMKTASVGTLLYTILGNEETARKVEDLLASSPNIPSKEQLMKIKGIGLSTAYKVLACCELSARYLVGTDAQKMLAPEDLVARLAFLKYETQEHFCVVTLDAANHVIGVHELTTGLVNQCPVHPREAFRKALLDNAVSVVFAHNHPSGNTEPSQEDFAITRVLVAAGRVMQIPVLDHIVISRAGHTSLLRNNPEIFEKEETCRHS